MRILIRYFLRGLLLVAPTALTIYLIWLAVEFLDGILTLSIPGLGLVIILASITMIGFLGSTILAKPIISGFEKLMARLPLINIIYTSLNDLFTAFVGDQRKFDKPVMVRFGNDSNLVKLGFITRENMEELGLQEMVSVYFPHSYNFSGNHFLVERKYVTPLSIPSVEVMKFIVSGGVSKLKLEKYQDISHESEASQDQHS